MPGHDPHEAVREFLEPLEDALAVLDGFTKLFVSGSKPYRKGHLYAWVLNGPEGKLLPGVGLFSARMNFEVIDCDPNRYEKPLRVTTRAYSYSLDDEQGSPRWRLDWHPGGKSPVSYPHVHMPPNMKDHNPTERATFERAIGWCVAAGARLTCSVDEALNHLLVTESRHRLHRSWHLRPDEQQLNPAG
jgi:hypothetical protein